MPTDTCLEDFVASSIGHDLYRDSVYTYDSWQGSDEHDRLEGPWSGSQTDISLSLVTDDA
jgi:hypothetical protein